MSDINQVVTGLQGNPVSSTSPSVGDALVWDGYHWTPTSVPVECYGSLTMYENTTAISTSGYGYVLINTGYANNGTKNTTLNATNGSITINENCQAVLNFHCSFSFSGGSGPLYYQFAFFKNGSIMTDSTISGIAWDQTGSVLTNFGMTFMYAATSGDVIDVRVTPVSGSDPDNRPSLYFANFNVWSV